MWFLHVVHESDMKSLIKVFAILSHPLFSYKKTHSIINNIVIIINFNARKE